MDKWDLTQLNAGAQHNQIYCTETKECANEN